jgi:protein O-GlcNAc transferase
LTAAVSRAQDLFDAGDIERAVAGFKDALEQAPTDLQAAKGLGHALDALRHFDDAFDAWTIAEAISPGDVISRYALAEAWQRRGDVVQARRLFMALCADYPGNYSAQTMALMSLLYNDNGLNSELIDIQKTWGGLRVPARDAVYAEYAGATAPERPLRIGFVSSGFRAHSVGFNILPVILELDRRNFSTYCYAQLRAPDNVSAMFQDRSDYWRDITGLNDQQAAAVIHGDKIDILVLLAGHADENRPFIARFRPAPVQISHHDICTSAMPEMDYWIGDPIVSPRGEAEYFSERVLRIPNFTVQPIPAETPVPVSPPSQDKGFITFGSFNAPQKITPKVIEIWSKILIEVPDSRLILKYFDAFTEKATRQRLLDLFGAQGVEAARLEFLSPSESRAAHLSAYARVDIALDPFPFGGATTTFEALLMGIPVISLLDERFTGWCGAATLESVGLSLCVAQDESDYINRAAVLAQDVQGLAALRRSLPTLVRRSGVCDMKGHVRNLQRVYRAVWRRYCASHAATGSEISHHTGV